MKTMNMPGFTAENSLYIGRKQCNMTATKFLAVKAVIRPQRTMQEYCDEWASDFQKSLNQFGQYAVAGKWNLADSALFVANVSIGRYANACL